MDEVERLARKMEPVAWAEYDAGKGVCSNDAGFRVLASIEAAKRAGSRVTPAEFRAAHGLSRPDAAKLFGYTVRGWNRVEASGKWPPGANQLAKLCEVMPGIVRLLVEDGNGR